MDLDTLFVDVLVAGVFGIETVGELGRVVPLGKGEVGTVQAGLQETGPTDIGGDPHGITNHRQIEVGPRHDCPAQVGPVHVGGLKPGVGQVGVS